MASASPLRSPLLPKSRGGIHMAALALGLILLLLIACLVIPGAWPGHFRKGFGARSSLHSLSLEEQIRSVARKPGDLKHTLEAEEQAMFEQIDIDFAPYEDGITLEMVEQAYCACRLGGFRFQSIGNELYVAGEVHSPQSRHETVKRQLLDLMTADGYLPDVDMYFAGFDLPENCTVDEMPANCRQRGPHFQSNKRPEDDWIILHPDWSFGGWPEVKINNWAETQQLMGAAASHQQWQDRSPELFFAGANLGYQRRNFSFVDWKEYPEMDIRWVDWNDPSTLVPIHDFCNFRHLLHLDGCAWSCRLKYLLLCKAAVVFPDSPYIEFWYRALTPGRNMLSVPEIKRQEDGVHVLRAAQRLLRDEELGQRLGAAAQATALHTLSVKNVREYWRRLLHKYASLQTFQPKKHPDAHPFHATLIEAVKIAPEERTCSICGHPSWESFRWPFCRGVDNDGIYSLG